jgi:hypothetical protein
MYIKCIKETENLTLEKVYKCNRKWKSRFDGRIWYSAMNDLGKPDVFNTDNVEEYEIRNKK